LRTGPPSENPKMFLSSFGGLFSSPSASCDSFRKYSFDENAVLRFT
jgi:hypothetical protein